MSRIKTLTTYLSLSLLIFTINLTAETGEDDSLKRELTEEELDARIGRMGEVEEIPEGFEFSKAENRLWFENHLKNIEQPMRLYYEFSKTGSYEDGFVDSVYLDILKVNSDGTKNASLDFFSADRKQVVHPDNVTNIMGNPILGVYMQGDVYEMNRLTEGHWRHFQKMIKIALRETATVEEIDFEFKGKQYTGDKIHFAPYLEDPHRQDFLKFADKYYEFVFSDEIPGMLYSIKTVIPDRSGEDKEPLVKESLTLLEVSSN
jgi:hypothetical protein